MLERNQVLTLRVERLGDEAQGIALHEGMVVFVPKALPGELVRVRIIKPDKRYAIARLEEVLEASGERVKPPCPYAPRCGGCVAQHMRYEASLSFKQQQVLDCLQRIAGIPNPPVSPILGMDNPWRYRNKGAFPVGGSFAAPRIGCYAPRSHEIIDAPWGCLLQDERSDRLVTSVRRWIIENHLEPYDEKNHKGLIKHVVTRVTRSQESMLCLVIRGESLPHAKDLVERALQAEPGLRGLFISTNLADNNVIFGEDCRCLWGKPSLNENLCGLPFSLSPRAFFQVNPWQTERLYQTALDFAGLEGHEQVADVYSGTGTLSLLLAQRAREVIGLEWSKDAVADATDNALRCGISNATFICDDAAKALPQLVAQGKELHMICLDPPRKGCDEAVLAAACSAQPRKMVYVSCNPATLARDAVLLLAKGYALTQVQPVDMFCWTGSVECVCLFERN